MARDITYWYNVMMGEKESMATLNVYQPVPDTSQTFLTALLGSSKVQSWRLIFWCVATGYYALDVVLDLFKIDLEAIAAKSRYGTDPWYAAKALEFQYGDTLTQIDLEWKYAVINDANRVVKLSSVRSIPGRVNIKVATLVAGVAQPLPTPQYNALKAYFAKVRPSVARVNIINALPDELRLYLDVNYDPLVLTSSGELISTPGVYPVRDAVNKYLLNLEFNSRFELMNLINYVEEAVGKSVVSAYVNSASARYGSNPFVAFTQKYYPNAGYMVIDPATPLSSSITYTANV